MIPSITKSYEASACGAAGRGRDVHRSDDVELVAWNLGEPFAGLAHKHLDGCTPIRKSACADQSASSIAAHPSKDRDTLATWIP